MCFVKWSCFVIQSWLTLKKTFFALFEKDKPGLSWFLDQFWVQQKQVLVLDWTELIKIHVLLLCQVKTINPTEIHVDCKLHVAGNDLKDQHLCRTEHHGTTVSFSQSKCIDLSSDNYIRTSSSSLHSDLVDSWRHIFIMFKHSTNP